jgi:hypothetical protein
MIRKGGRGELAVAVASWVGGLPSFPAQDEFTAEFQAGA